MADNTNEDGVLRKYVDVINENARLCDKRSDRYIYLFIVTSIVFYLLSKIETVNIELHNVSVEISIPQYFLMIVAPLILVYIFYSYVSFIVLTDIYREVLSNAWEELSNKTQIQINEFQLAILKPPSYLTCLDVLKKIGSSSSFLKIIHVVLLVVHFFCLFIVPPLVIYYFIWKSASLIALLSSVLLFVVCSFIIFLSIYEFIESCRHKPPSIKILK